MEKEDVLYWMMMGSLSVIMVWIVLKAAGIIQTPVWIQMIPYAGAVFFAGTIAQSFRFVQSDVKVLKHDMTDVRERTVRLEERAKHTDKDIHDFKHHVDKEFGRVHTLLGK